MRRSGKIIFSLLVSLSSWGLGPSAKAEGFSWPVKEERTPEFYMERTEDLAFDSGMGAPLRYRLFKPKNFDPQKKYPLVMIFHGAGERGNDNLKHMMAYVAGWTEDAFQEKYPCIILMPQCPRNDKWVNVEWAAGRFTFSPDAMTQAMRQVNALFLEYDAKPYVDPRRIYVMGASMGGYGTWDFVMRNADKVAAAVPVCGGGDPSQAEKLIHTPIWAFHGDPDPTVPTRGSTDMIAAIKAAGGTQTHLTLYPGVGHGSFRIAWKEPEMIHWLFSKQKEEAP